eukprot:jgi/Chrzof1/9389/Cz04g01070.t1
MSVRTCVCVSSSKPIYCYTELAWYSSNQAAAFFSFLIYVLHVESSEPSGTTQPLLWVPDCLCATWMTTYIQSRHSRVLTLQKYHTEVSSSTVHHRSRTAGLIHLNQFYPSYQS